MGVIENIKERWFDIQVVWNPWISLGFHIDHKDPSLTLHLMGAVISIGWLKQPGFPHSLRRSLGNDDIPARSDYEEDL